MFDEVLGLVGMRLADHLDLVRLDPQVRYHWPDGSTLDVADQPSNTRVAFDRFSAGAGAAWEGWDRQGERIWAIARRTFLAGSMDAPRAVLRRLQRPSDLWAIDGHRSLARAARRTFADDRLVQWAGRYATYSGSSPFAAPATLACIPHIESAYGAWYPRGGMGTLTGVLEAGAARAGVTMRREAAVARVDALPHQVTGVQLTTGERLAADVVVANTDADHLYRDLLADDRALARVRRAEPSSSAFVVLAALDGRTADVAHHNVWFSADGEAEFAQLFAHRQLPKDPTIYASVASVTDAGQAPPGCESWFLLVNAPAGWRGDAAAYRDHVLAVLAARGVDLRPRLRFTEIVTPADLERRYRSRGGAIYGASSNGWRAAFLRPGNRGPRRGLYLVGGSSHPGGGLPLVAISAEIVAGLVEDDGW